MGNPGSALLVYAKLYSMLCVLSPVLVAYDESILPVYILQTCPWGEPTLFCIYVVTNRQSLASVVCFRARALLCSHKAVHKTGLNPPEVNIFVAINGLRPLQSMGASIVALSRKTVS